MEMAQLFFKKWSLRPEGWLKSNTDAIFRDGLSASIVVLRNNKGEIV